MRARSTLLGVLLSTAVAAVLAHPAAQVPASEAVRSWVAR